MKNKTLQSRQVCCSLNKDNKGQKRGNQILPRPKKSRIKISENMKQETIRIEGIATIGKRSFRFDSGLPSNEPILEHDQKLHGQMHIHQNGDAEFVDNGRVYLPPIINEIARGENFKLRRTTRHYILQVKVPVVESRKETETKISAISAEVLGEITMDRKELLML